MHHLIVVAHPDPRSFTMSMAQAYAQTVEGLGQTTDLRDLYQLAFAPCLPANELPWAKTFRVGADVMRERAAARRADVIVLVYPLWFNAAPAMLKGYVDRVFGLGFGFSEHHQGGNQPLLGDKKLVCFSCSGAPQHWVESSGAWAAMQTHFDQHLAAVTGMQLIGHHNIDGILPDLSKEAVDRHLHDVRRHAEAIAQAYSRAGST